MTMNDFNLASLLMDGLGKFDVIIYLFSHFIAIHLEV